MAEPIVITSSDSGGEGTAFAAGVAAATAVVATETAEGAAQTAAAAADDAQTARQRASAAEVTADQAMAAVHDLEERMMGVIGELVQAINGVAVAAEIDDGLPEVIITEPAEPSSSAEPPRRTRRERTGWGSNLWFGGRA